MTISRQQGDMCSADQISWAKGFMVRSLFRSATTGQFFSRVCLKQVQISQEYKFGEQNLVRRVEGEGETCARRLRP